jgi:predicted amidohydrolase YtcJ
LVRGRQKLLEKAGPAARLTREDKLEALRIMQKGYIMNGLTTAFLRGCPLEDLAVIRHLDSLGELDLRFNITHVLPLSRLINEKSDDKTRENIDRYIDSLEPLRALNSPRIKFNTLKIHMDGGILTGTALMRKPWGRQAVFQIEDPVYHGYQSTPAKVIGFAVDKANQNGWQFTAHATGDSGVQLLLNAYENTCKNAGDISKKRFQVTHGDFFGTDQMAQAKTMGVIMDAQWPWLYLDGPLMSEIMERGRLRDFMPFGAWAAQGLVVGGGSDHMIGFDAKEAINPFHPFTGLWVMHTGMMRNGRRLGPGHRVDRRTALKIYTIKNAFMGFDEARTGSLEKGKLADLIVISGDYLNCPADSLKDLRVVLTMIDGKMVFKNLP